MKTRPGTHTKAGNLLLRSPRWHTYARIAELARQGRVVHDGTCWTTRSAKHWRNGTCDREVAVLVGQRPLVFARVDERLVKLARWERDGSVWYPRTEHALAPLLLLTDHGYACLIAACNVHGVTLAELVRAKVVTPPGCVQVTRGGKIQA